MVPSTPKVPAYEPTEALGAALENGFFSFKSVFLIYSK